MRYTCHDCEYIFKTNNKNKCKRFPPIFINNEFIYPAIFKNGRFICGEFSKQYNREELKKIGDEIKSEAMRLLRRLEG